MAVAKLAPWVSTINGLVDRIFCLMRTTHLHARAFLVDLGEVVVGEHQGPLCPPTVLRKD